MLTMEAKEKEEETKKDDHRDSDENIKVLVHKAR
jgi:hypothetical protein